MKNKNLKKIADTSFKRILKCPQRTGFKKMTNMQNKQGMECKVVEPPTSITLVINLLL